MLIVSEYACLFNRNAYNVIGKPDSGEGPSPDWPLCSIPLELPIRSPTLIMSMHFLDFCRRTFLTAVFVLGLCFLVSAHAIPVRAPDAIDLPEPVKSSQVDHLSSRKPGHKGGWATYYDTEEGKGACGKYNRNKEHVVAIGKPLWESTQGQSGASTLCGKTATVRWRGKSVRVRVVDECPVCGYNDIDLSPAAFQQLMLANWMGSRGNSTDGMRIHFTAVRKSLTPVSSLLGLRNSTKPVLTLSGHKSRIRSTVFSPDGKLVASASDDNTVRIWDVQSGSEATDPFKEHTGHVNAAMFSPDGTRIASCSRDHSILIWDVRQQKVIAAPLDVHTDWVWSVGFSPDGALLVSGSKDCTIRIWDVHTGTLIKGSLTGHTDAVYSVVFSPDGNRIVSGSGDKTIRIWDVQSGETVVGPLEGHSDSVWSISISPDGSRIASGSRDFTVRVWDSQTGATIAGPFQGHFSPVFSVSFSPDGNRIMSGAQNGVVYMWEAHTGVMILNLAGANSAVTFVAFSPEGKRIVYGCGNGTVVVHSLIESPLKGEEVPEGTLEILAAGHMSNNEAFDQMVLHGCTDMRPTIDPEGYSDGPACAGGFGDVWKGRLIGGVEVAVKTWQFSFMAREDPKQLKVTCNARGLQSVPSQTREHPRIAGRDDVSREVGRGISLDAIQWFAGVYSKEPRR
ncbi:WD-repeat-containing protein [Rhizoctonia solani AG-1 IA]|uniref:WD-repeat-containing protein n=1 Tax=Thanatephorus cucumeris (strain AG1-IA) TaxID=983506 RepID=L8X928_THACA|nr:WD-repeat-containing protein [Rhizoctonia solani AG-1 IA]